MVHMCKLKTFKKATNAFSVLLTSIVIPTLKVTNSSKFLQIEEKFSVILVLQ
jgi:hypothetical protein